MCGRLPTSFMTIEPQKPMALSVTSVALLTVSQASIGCGLGILLAGRIDERRRTIAAVGLMSLALGATISAGIGLVTDLVSGPRSRLGVRRRLRSIREDSGLHAEDETF
jgi:hypothetical protein